MNKLWLCCVGLVLLVCCKPTDSTTEQGEVIESVGIENVFAQGERIVLDESDAANVRAIRRVVYPSSDPTLVSDRTAYVFDFKYRPEQITYTLVLPKVDGRQLVQYSNGVFEPLSNVRIENGAARVEVNTRFSTSKSEDLMVCVAWIDTARFYANYRFTKDPFDANPLCAQAEFGLTQGVELELTIKGQNNNDIVVPFGHQSRLVVPIYGLYKGDNDLYYTLSCNGLKYRLHQYVYCAVPHFNNVVVDTKFASGFRNHNNQIYVTSGQSINYNTGWKPSDPHDGRLLVGYDQWGKLRLLHQNKQWGAVYTLRYQGRHVFVRNRPGDLVYELIDYSGQVVDSICYNDPTRRLHHDAANGPSEGIVVIPYGYGVDECGIIEYNTATKQWGGDIDLRTVVSSTRSITPDEVPNDPIHINSVVYSASDDCYVISARHQGIVKIKRGTKELQWIITPHINLTPPASDINLTSKVLTPTNFENTPEHWNIGQHNAIILPDGSVACFDNHNRPLVGEVATDRYSRLVVFRVDQTAMRVTKVWNYHTPDKKFSWYMGGCQWNDDQNTLLGAWPVQQYSAEVQYATGQVVWESSFKPTNTFGDIYRTYKIRLYE